MHAQDDDSALVALVEAEDTGVVASAHGKDIFALVFSPSAAIGVVPNSVLDDVLQWLVREPEDTTDMASQIFILPGRPNSICLHMSLRKYCAFHHGSVSDRGVWIVESKEWMALPL